MELEHPIFLREGLRFDPTDLESDCLQLLAIFYAQMSEAPANYLDRASQYMDWQTGSLLLKIAAQVRSKLDSAGFPAAVAALHCGTLCRDTRNPADLIKLTVREACNKILHAKRVRFDGEQRDAHNPHAGYRLSTKLFLYGEHSNREWKTELELQSFCDHACTTAEKV